MDKEDNINPNLKSKAYYRFPVNEMIVRLRGIYVPVSNTNLD